MNPTTAKKLDRYLKMLLWLCAAGAITGLCLQACGRDAGMVIVFGSMAIAAAPAFHFAAKVAFIKREPRSDQN